MITAKHLNSLGINLIVVGDKLKYLAPRGVLTQDIVDNIKQHKATIIAELAKDFNYWADRVNSATTQDEVLAIVSDEFRLLTWTDEQRAKMSHVYVRQLARLKHN